MYFSNKLIEVMTKKMLQFTELDQQTPSKREVGNRKEDFNEIYGEYISDKAKDASWDLRNAECLFAKYIVL